MLSFIVIVFKKERGIKVRKRKKIMLASLIGLVTLSSVGVGSVMAQDEDTRDTTATIKFTDDIEINKLTFLNASEVIDFGSEIFTFEEETYDAVSIDNQAKDFVIKLEDARINVNDGWTLKASATNLDGGLPVGSTISFPKVEPISDSDLQGFAPTLFEDGFDIVVGGEEIDDLVKATRKSDATEQEGIGKWNLNFSREGIKLHLTAEQKAEMTQKVGNEDGYSATITWTLGTPVVD